MHRARRALSASACGHRRGALCSVEFTADISVSYCACCCGLWAVALEKESNSSPESRCRILHSSGVVRCGSNTSASQTHRHRGGGDQVQPMCHTKKKVPENTSRAPNIVLHQYVTHTSDVQMSNWQPASVRTRPTRKPASQRHRARAAAPARSLTWRRWTGVPSADRTQLKLVVVWVLGACRRARARLPRHGARARPHRRGDPPSRRGLTWAGATEPATAQCAGRWLCRDPAAGGSRHRRAPSHRRVRVLRVRRRSRMLTRRPGHTGIVSCRRSPLAAVHTTGTQVWTPDLVGR
jgi:hypothetical protein